MHSSKRSWKLYPTTYRAAELQQIATWIRAGESGSLIGLAGAGKSNLLGFLFRQPHLMADLVGLPLEQFVLIQVDLNNLPTYDLATLFRLILRSVFEGRAGLSAPLQQGIEVLYRKVEASTDPFLCQSALREWLALAKESQARVVFIFDPFDVFCQTATTPMFDNLRGLRDSFKATLSYLFGLRRPVSYLRDPLQLGELYEVIDMHVCWLGAMNDSDSRWVISQAEQATQQAFSEETIAELIRLTGGYPALLRAASFWRATVAPVPNLADWEALLATEPSLQNRLRDMRLSLTGEEEATLFTLQQTLAQPVSPQQVESLRQIGQKYHTTLQVLQQKRLCQYTETGWQIFSPIVAHFIAHMEGVSAGRIRYEARSQRFWQGERELTHLSAKDIELLRHFMTHPLMVHSIDDLIDAAWVEDDSSGVSKEAVQQAIRHLRKQIEPNPAKPCYLLTEHRVGYRFFPEGAPQG